MSLEPEHEKEISKFFDELYKITFGSEQKPDELEQKPDLLFHYTSSDGLNGILKEEKNLRASYIGTMDDGNEYIHAFSRMLTRFELLRNQNLSEHKNSFADHIRSRLREMSPENYFPVCVVCFTDVEDSYDHWKNYGHQNGGFSISFDRECLEKQINCYGAVLLPVIYDQKKQLKIIKKISDWILTKGSELLQAGSSQDYIFTWGTKVFEKVSLYAAIFKAKHFINENEWRVIYLVQPGKEINFHSKAALYMAYVNLPIYDCSLHSICVGPGVYQRSNMESIRSILNKNSKKYVYIRSSFHREIK